MKRWTAAALIRAALGLAALVSAAGVAPATAAWADGEIDGPWYIVNTASNRCLDAAAEGHGANGTRIQLWDCYPPTQYNQMWYRRWRTTTTFELINVASGTCLDVPANSGGLDGTAMQLWDCYPPTQYNQMWRMLGATGGTGWWFQSVANAKILDADASGIAWNGTKVQIWYIASGYPNQIWKLKRPNEF